MIRTQMCAAPGREVVGAGAERQERQQEDPRMEQHRTGGGPAVAARKRSQRRDEGFRHPNGAAAWL